MSGLALHEWPHESAPSNTPHPRELLRQPLPATRVGRQAEAETCTRLLGNLQRGMRTVHDELAECLRLKASLDARERHLERLHAGITQRLAMLTLDPCTGCEGRAVREALR